MSTESTTRDPQPVTVLIGATFATLVARADVFCRRVERRLFPGTDGAQLVSDYGRIALPSRPWADVAPMAFEGQCCEVRITVAGAVHTLFRGLVTSDVRQPDGTFADADGDVSTGQVLHAARGMDYLLERISPHQSVTAAYGGVGELFAFGGRGTPPEKNRSATQTGSPASHLFAWGDTAEHWSALDIVRYLLRFAAAQTAYSWTIDASAAIQSALDGVTPQVDPRGRSLRECLAECIRMQDGFAVRWNVTGTAVTMTVVSLSDTDIVAVGGAVAVPANADTISLGEAFATDRDLSAPVVTPVAESSYAAVEVYGEPIRVTAMLSRASNLIVGVDGFTKDWDDADEIDFVSATDDEASQERFRDVYAAWRLPADWNRRDWEGNIVVPSYDPATGDIDWATADALAVPAVVFERTVPRSETETGAPLLLLLVEGAYVQPDRGYGERAAVGLVLADDGPGIRMRTRHNGAFATGGITSTAQRDYNPIQQGFLATVSFYTHTPVAIRQVAAGAAGTKCIYAPGHHLWVCPGRATWSYGQAIGPQAILRDDRPALKFLAAQLAAWYGRRRATVQMGAAVAPGAVRVGQMVSTVFTDGAWTAVGTPVTSESWTWDDGGNFGYILATDYADLNLQAITRRRVEAGEREINRRIRRIEESLRGAVVREPIGADWARFRLMVNATSNPYSISANWALPQWLDWRYGHGGGSITIPAGVSDGLIFVQLMETPHGSTQGLIRLVANIAGVNDPGESAYLNTVITGPSQVGTLNPSWGNLPTPALYIPVARWIGTVGGYSLQVLPSWSQARDPFAQWAPWLTHLYRVRHGYISRVVYFNAITNYYTAGSVQVVQGAAVGAPGGLPLPAVAGSFSAYYVSGGHTLTTTPSVSGGGSTRYYPLLASCTHDGAGNLLAMSLNMSIAMDSL